MMYRNNLTRMGVRRSARFLCLCASVLGLTCGCVQRVIKITSEPAGALVYLNDEEVGRTPVRVPFTFYGTYDVRLENEGYQPLWTQKETDAPWWEAPGPDLFAEAIPGVHVELDWHFKMQLVPLVNESELIKNAGRTRSLLDNPPPPDPGPPPHRISGSR